MTFCPMHIALARDVQTMFEVAPVSRVTHTGC